MDNIIYQNKIIKTISTKFAIFDIDWTLIKPKEGKKFPKDINDWQWLRESVPNTLKYYYKNKYRIIFLTDQSKLWKVDMIKNIIKELNIPITCLIAMNKIYYKPNPTFFFDNFKDKYDENNSFYVGDAAGRNDDWSDSDKIIASILNVKFYTPEEIFSLDKINQNIEILNNTDKEIIILVGYPASGKTTIYKSLFELKGYIHISGDVFKTSNKMLKEADKYIDSHSIVFDATNGTKKKREIFINYAKNKNISVRCIWKTTTIDKAMEQNKERALTTGIKIPDIVFYVYKKHFEEPTNDECDLIKIN